MIKGEMNADEARNLSIKNCIWDEILEEIFLEIRAKCIQGHDMLIFKKEYWNWRAPNINQEKILSNLRGLGYNLSVINGIGAGTSNLLISWEK